MNQNMSWDLQ